MSTQTAAPAVIRRSVIAPLNDVEWRQAENGRSENYTFRGHAAVFNRPSEDLGGFREILAPGAFRSALRGSPDIRLLKNHDPNYVLARTTARVDGKPSLEIREDATGLHTWALVQPRGWVNDLRIEMQGGLIDQMSYAFVLNDDGDDWEVADNGTVTRTIRTDGIKELFDVSVVTYPATLETDATMRELRSAVACGRLPVSVLGEPAETDVSAPETVADVTPRTEPRGGVSPLELAKRKARMRIGHTPNP